MEIMEKHPQQRRKASKSIEKHHKAPKDVGMHGEASKSMEGHHKASKSVEKHVEKHAQASKSIQWPSSAAKRTIQSVILYRTAEPSPKGSKHIKKIQTAQFLAKPKYRQALVVLVLSRLRSGKSCHSS